MYHGFRIRVHTQNDMIIGRWLCLDSLLDRSLELDEIPAEERHLPLSAWDGTRLLLPGEYAPSDICEGRMVYAASSALICAPVTSTRHFVATHNRLGRFEDLPYRLMNKVQATSIDLKKGVMTTVMTRRKTLNPTTLEWRGHGDPERAADLLSNLFGIGAKSGSGYGRYRFNPHEDIEPDDEPLCGIVSSGIGLLRPVPENLIQGLGINHFTRGFETFHPPYWDNNLAVEVALPISNFSEGVMTLPKN